MRTRKVNLGAHRAGSTVHAVYDHQSDDYVLVSSKRFAEICSAIRLLPQSNPSSRKVARLVLGTAQEVVVDEQGVVEIDDVFE